MYTYQDRAKLREKYKNITPYSSPYEFIDFDMFTKNSVPEMYLWNEIRTR